MEMAREKPSSSRRTCSFTSSLVLIICLLAVTLTLQGIAAEGPSESECRPLIEKALKEQLGVGSDPISTDSNENVDSRDESREVTPDSGDKDVESAETQEDGDATEGGTDKDDSFEEQAQADAPSTQDDSADDTKENEDSTEEKIHEESETETEEDNQKSDEDGASIESQKETESEDATSAEAGAGSIEGTTSTEEGTEESAISAEDVLSTETADKEQDATKSEEEADTTKEDLNKSTEINAESSKDTEDVSKEDGEDAASTEDDTKEHDTASTEDGVPSVEDVQSAEKDTTSAEEGTEAEEKATSTEEGAASAEEGAASAEEGTPSVEESTASVEEDAASIEEGKVSIEEGAGSAEESAPSVEEGTGSVEESTASVEEGVISAEDAASVEGVQPSEGGASVEEGIESAALAESAESAEDGEPVEGAESLEKGTESVEATESIEEGAPSKEDAASIEEGAASKEDAASIEGAPSEGDEISAEKETAEEESKEEQKDADTVEEESKETDTENVTSVETGTDSSEGAASIEELAEKSVEDTTEEEKDETAEETETEEVDETPEADLTQETLIPENLRPRDHLSELLHLDEESAETEVALAKAADVTLRELKRIYDTAIKPLEILYKYRDLSNRHFGDPEIFSKPLILFMGPWSGGKSSIINYLLDNEYNDTSLRTGAEPSPAYFNILMWGAEPEILDGTQLAADWTFSGLQKFGQGLEDRLRGLKLPNKLLEKVNIVEIPGILEVRKVVSRMFPFNDACQWFIDRADIIFLVYDPSKLDVGPETEAILDQLKGREYQTRIILNKADTVKPEELMRVQSALIWNISPLMSSPQPPVMYTTSLWSTPFTSGAPIRLLQAQERAFLRDLRQAVDKRVENKISSARRFAVRVRNHAKMVDCYLTTYYNHKSLFGNRKQIADEIIENPQQFHIYEGLSTLTNISRYDLPDPDVYKDFFKLNALYDFQPLSATCTYFRGCPINRLDVAIAYDLPELVGKHKKLAESATGKPNSNS